MAAPQNGHRVHNNGRADADLQSHLDESQKAALSKVKAKVNSLGFSATSQQGQ